MTWNIEGLRRNIHNLKFFISEHSPDLICLSEPQIFKPDCDAVMAFLETDYSHYLNSPDSYDVDLPLRKRRAFGGTLLLWKRKFDPYVAVHTCRSSSAVALVLKPPGFTTTIHVCVYLPTLGHEHMFTEELSNLSLLIEELRQLYPCGSIYLRGNFNVSEKNEKRSILLNTFIQAEGLFELDIPHQTYHHFLGQGVSDSKLDRILYTCKLQPEFLVKIHCKLEHPLVDSHHDVVVSSFACVHEESSGSSEDPALLIAPKIDNTRHRILWDDDGIMAYQKLILPHLRRLQCTWLTESPSRTSMALFNDFTTNLLTSSARFTNQSRPLMPSDCRRNQSTPRAIKLSARKVLRMWKLLRHLKGLHDADSEIVKTQTNAFKHAKFFHRKLLRSHKSKEANERDSKLLENPSATFARIRHSRRSKSGMIGQLKVGSKLYSGPSVPDGFYDSILTLKTRNDEKLRDSEYYASFSSDYDHIIQLCQESVKIESVSIARAMSLLERLKPNVPDFYSLTPDHFIHAGPAGIAHFCILLNSLLHDIKNVSITEINTAYECVLFKGHDRDKSLAKSYRTISSCPVVAKALDLHLRDLHLDSWDKCQPETQFQGQGSSHELASLLLTECIQYSLHSIKKPAYVLYLDAQAAFDVVQRKLLIRNLYHSQTPDQSIIYQDLRLSARQTVVDWNGNLMGPINDSQGLEQGGINSSDLYKIYGHEQLTMTQSSGLGIHMGGLHIASIGQADDTALVTNDIHNLFYLLELSNIACRKNMIDIGADKTRLQVYAKKGFMVEKDVETPIFINEQNIPFTDLAEHVGVIRSTSGNGPALMSRISAHRKALASVLHTGIARSHRGNPASGVKIEKLYATPVLLSGISSLVLSNDEFKLIDSHYSEVLRCILRLHTKTPRCVTLFLAGSLPGSALIHMRQLSMFEMICRLQNNVLHKHAINIFTSETYSPKSWFFQIRSYCVQYGLPHPLDLLSSPPNKSSFKILVRKKIISYWEEILRDEALQLRSLVFFNPGYMSLMSAHPMIISAGTSPAKVAMATIQMQMLSGRYRTDSLMRKWRTDITGYCNLSPNCSNCLDDIEHLLQRCIALEPSRQKLLSFTEKYIINNYLHADIVAVIRNFCNPASPSFCQFVLDCTTNPLVICLVQHHGSNVVLTSLFDITRTWIFVLHRERLKLRGQWKRGHN